MAGWLTVYPAKSWDPRIRAHEFLPCDATQSAVLPWQVCQSVRPSVCPSVTLRYRGHMGWNFSKIISRLISLWFLLCMQIPTSWIYSKWNIHKLDESMLLDNVLRVMLLTYFSINDKRECRPDCDPSVMFVGLLVRYHEFGQISRKWLEIDRR